MYARQHVRQPTKAAKMLYYGLTPKQHREV
nr:MAG TPA: hypothetical protein [Caudoviricetes sp.]DAR41598.1 MAG TPA: hypothetical protein [Caudoviricetes sp.]DAX62704.1 MAG TPA: hypothetical protein [Caudoviricetes sp.]